MWRTRTSSPSPLVFSQTQFTGFLHVQQYRQQMVPHLRALFNVGSLQNVLAVQKSVFMQDKSCFCVYSCCINVFTVDSFGILLSECSHADLLSDFTAVM